MIRPEPDYARRSLAQPSPKKLWPGPSLPKTYISLPYIVFTKINIFFTILKKMNLTLSYSNCH